jgi:hypothetical protein
VCTPLRSQLPSHPCLELEANCQQPIRRFFARRLIAMVKTKEPEHEVSYRMGRMEYAIVRFFAFP